MLYAIIYQLKNKLKNYSDLYQKIKDFGPWMHYIDTLWIIETPKSVDEIVTELRPFIDESNDYIVVFQINRPYQGWFAKEGWDWLNERTT